MKELDVKRAFRRLWEGWLSTYEFAIGGDAGAPDLQVIVGKRSTILPIELKRGVMKSGGIILPELVRPAQVGWHRSLHEAGGRSILLIGTDPFEDEEMFLVEGSRVTNWQSGFRIGTECWKLWPNKPSTLKRSLEQMLRDRRMFRADEI